MNDKNLPEAPASSTLKAISPGGFEIMITSRDFKDEALTKDQLAHLIRLDKALVALKFTPVVRGGFGPKQAKPVEYVEGRMCPLCQNKLIYATTKEGKRFIKCSTQKWDFATRQATGCRFVDWGDKPKETQGQEMADNPDY